MPVPTMVTVKAPMGAHGSNLLLCQWKCADQMPDPSLLHPRWSTQVRAVLATVGTVKDVTFIRGWGAVEGYSFAVVFRPTEAEMIPAFLHAFQELKRHLHKAAALQQYDSGHYASHLDPFGVGVSSNEEPSAPLPALTLESFGIIDESVASTFKQIKIGLPPGSGEAAVVTGGKRPREDESSTAANNSIATVPNFPYLPLDKATSMICMLVEDIVGGDTITTSTPTPTTSDATTPPPSPQWSAEIAARGILTRYVAPMAAAMGRIPNRSILDVLEGQTVKGDKGAANLGELFQLKYIATPQEQMDVLEKYQMAAGALFERMFFFISPSKVNNTARLFMMMPPEYNASQQLLSVIKQQLESTFAVVGKKPDGFDDGLMVGDGVQVAVAYRKCRVHTISILQFFTALQKV